MSPRKVSLEYRKQQTRTLLGFGVYYNENDSIKCYNIDLISSFQEEDTGFDVVNCFRYNLKIDILF